MGRNHFSFTYKLGNDLDYLVKRINMLLAGTIERKLRETYGGEECAIPVSILAKSLTGICSALMMTWFTESKSYDAKRFAAYIHTSAAAVIRASIFCRKESPAGLSGS